MKNLPGAWFDRTAKEPLSIDREFRKFKRDSKASAIKDPNKRPPMPTRKKG